MLPRPLRNPCLAVAVLLGLAACAATPPATPLARTPGFDRYSANLGEGFAVDYQVERKLSSINQRSCFAFITGTLINHSSRTLSRQAVLDIIVYSQGKPLFRDLTSPVSDIPPGQRAMFQMIDSPVHKDGCPVYDQITIDLRKQFKD